MQSSKIDDIDSVHLVEGVLQISEDFYDQLPS